MEELLTTEETYIRDLEHIVTVSYIILWRIIVSLYL